MITMIWAQDKNGAIGKDNQLPWHLPSDLKFFKEQTVGKTIVMGFKTFEGMGKRFLPNRETLLLVRNKNDYPEYADSLITTDELLDRYKNEDFIIVGGSRVYRYFMNCASKIIITHIDAEYEADTYMDPLPNYWSITNERVLEKTENEPNMTVRTYELLSQPYTVDELADLISDPNEESTYSYTFENVSLSDYDNLASALQQIITAYMESDIEKSMDDPLTLEWKLFLSLYDDKKQALKLFLSKLGNPNDNFLDKFMGWNKKS